MAITLPDYLTDADLESAGLSSDTARLLTAEGYCAAAELADRVELLRRERAERSDQ